MRELHQGRSLAEAPSNAAADNIARRIRGGQLKVGRYGHRAAPDLEGISTVAIAEKREGKADSRDAAKRRKAVERKILSEDVNVASGTLMSAGQLHLWNLLYSLILVDDSVEAPRQGTTERGAWALWV